MRRFGSLNIAQHYVSDIIDKPISASVEDIHAHAVLTKSSIDLGDGSFTNSYDLAFDHNIMPADIVAFDALRTAYDFISKSRHYVVASSGGFFYLADQASGSPRQLALNLSIARGKVRSLPVTDRESVITSRNNIEVQPLAALGSLCLNEHELEWSGALTNYDTDVKVYSNGNTVIKHHRDDMTGTIRKLEESSRYTPSILQDDMVDVGFINKGGNTFKGISYSSIGGLDIFKHDFVIRCPQRYARDDSILKINTIGGLALSRFNGGAFSAGPMLNSNDFNNHPINHDASLGDRPPFTESRLARSVLYKTDDAWTHIRLFDGRPGSPTHSGITPTETVSHILQEGAIEWGCFLDPGQTAKLCINRGQRIDSYGNRHYLRWPSETNAEFLWIPDTGRPVANVIAI